VFAKALDETKFGLGVDRSCMLNVAVAAELLSKAGAPSVDLFDLVGGKNRLEELANKPVGGQVDHRGGVGGAAPTKITQVLFVGNNTVIFKEEMQRELSITLAV
jgi:hypothetical protein